MTKEQFLADLGTWSDHRVLLWFALEATKDSPFPVCEFGAGDGSTPFIRAYCEANNRKFISYESNKEWAEKCGSEFVNDWDTANIYHEYSVCLIDHAPGEHRHKALAILKDKAQILVVHDSEVAATGYMLNKIWALFKYRANCRLIEGEGAEATALSNSIDVTGWLGLQESGFKIEG